MPLHRSRREPSPIVWLAIGPALGIVLLSSLLHLVTSGWLRGLLLGMVLGLAITAGIGLRQSRSLSRRACERADAAQLNRIDPLRLGRS